jgi:hypothetical protein
MFGEIEIKMESKEKATKEQQTKYNYCKLNKCHKTKTKSCPYKILRIKRTRTEPRNSTTTKDDTKNKNKEQNLRIEAKKLPMKKRRVV